MPTLDSENLRALELQKNGDFELAKKILESLVLNNPQNPALWGNLALVLEDLKDFNAAENAFLESVFLEKDSLQNAVLRTNYAAFLMKHFCGLRHNEALPHLEIALKNDSQNAIYFNALGVFYADKNENEKAIAFFEKSLKINNLHVPSRMNLAQLLLKIGDYQKGFKIGRRAYSNAFRQMPPYNLFPRGIYAPFEKNKNSFKNKDLLIIPEQGLGDEIHFSRFVPILKERLGFKKIHWICRESLVDLFTELPNIDFFEGLKTLQFGAHTFWQPHDFWCFLMDLPEILDFSPEKYNFQMPLFKKPQKSTVNEKNFLKIGILARGNPKHSNDAARSIHDESVFKPLYNLKNVQIINFEKTFKNFLETSQSLLELDFLVSVDSALSHLAGSLNLPTFLLLPQFRSDWRWGIAQNKTFWYPNHTLIRQEKSQCWQAEISKIANFLREKVAKF